MSRVKVLLFIIAVYAILAGLCLIVPEDGIELGGVSLQFPGIKEVASSLAPKAKQPASPSPEELLEQRLSEIRVAENNKFKSYFKDNPARIHFPDDDVTLFDPFFRALENAGNKSVRILHYGDSQIEEDRITQQIRETLQQRYGGSGVGLMPLLQTIPSLTVRQELRMNGRLISASQAQQGPARYLVYGPKSMQRTDGLYGAMGQVAIMADSLVPGSEEVVVVCKPQTASAHYSTWRIFADTTIHYSVSGDTVHLTGRGAIYGLSQETNTGVIVDNIPMRGCLGTTVFTKIDSTQLATFYREENVRLIILQYGGNAIPENDKPETIHGFVKSYRKQVRYLRRCAPHADILFIGPSDMVRLKDGVWQSYPMISFMDKLLRKMCLEENIAYFSLYQYMGGAGSMLRWREQGLAGSDGIHFYRNGARKAGNAVATWLLEPLTPNP